MLDLPAPILNVLSLFSPLFSKPIYKNMVFLLVGHILTRGRRTIADILRTLNLQYLQNFSKFHWVLSRAKWSALKASGILFLEIIDILRNLISGQTGAFARGSFSITVLMAMRVSQEEHCKIPLQNTAWYRKHHVTFSDVLGYVRLAILKKKYYAQFGLKTELGKRDIENLILRAAAA